MSSSGPMLIACNCRCGPTTSKVVAYLKEGRQNNGKDPVERFIFPPEKKAEERNYNFTSSQKVIIYPNPSKDGSFVLKLEDKNSVVLEVTNTIGQKVPFENIQDGEIVKMNLENAAAGVYFVKVSQNSKSNTYKVIID